MKILVTAVNGDIGQTAIKIIKDAKMASTIVGTDCSKSDIGKYFVDEFVKVSGADDPNYIKEIEKYCAKYDIDVIIPISEPEILRLKEIGEIRGAKVIKANKKAIEICLDKLRTYELMCENNIPVPWTRELNQKPIEYPCILKDRSSCGSKSFAMIENESDLEYYRRKRTNSILQEMLLPNHEEYTCGVFCGTSNKIFTIALHRTLLGGLTGYAEVVRSEEIENYCIKIAKLLNLRGSINIQLRLTSDGPKVFEINPRFSSTMYFRHKVGFEDLVWSINDILGKQVPDTISVDYTKKFYRYYESLIV